MANAPAHVILFRLVLVRIQCPSNAARALAAGGPVRS